MLTNIIKTFKQIRFVIKSIARICFGIFIGLFIWRDKKTILIGNCPNPVFKVNGRKEQFLHNTKYLYLYLNNNKSDLKYIYLCEDEERINKMKQCGLKNICKRNSIKGVYYALRAKYWITDYDIATVANPWYAYNAVVINLWHGTGGLKIFEAFQYKNKIIKNVYKFLIPKCTYYNVDSEHEAKVRKTAFELRDKQIKILGSPRFDVFYNKITCSDLFMEEDFTKIKQFKKQGKKIFFYMPTWRDTGKNVSEWLKTNNLKQFLSKNDAILVCKLHPADKNSLDLSLTKELYSMDKSADVCPVLKYADCLISDYSSVYFDFLLLDRPIIYYVPDLEEYQEQCRGFYEPYEKLTTGVKTRTEEELIQAMQDVIDGIDNYKDDRKRLRDQTFKYQDGKNCERIIDWIKSLKG